MYRYSLATHPDINLNMQLLHIYLSIHLRTHRCIIQIVLTFKNLNNILANLSLIYSFHVCIRETLLELRILYYVVHTYVPRNF